MSTTTDVDQQLEAAAAALDHVRQLADTITRRVHQGDEPASALNRAQSELHHAQRRYDRALSTWDLAHHQHTNTASTSTLPTKGTRP